MPHPYTVLSDGRINYRVRVVGAYKGQPFDYTEPEGRRSGHLRPDGNPSSYWWSEGNMRCACSRGRFVGEDITECDAESPLVDYVLPVDCPKAPALVLNESGRFFTDESTEDDRTAVLNGEQLPEDLKGLKVWACFSGFDHLVEVVTFSRRIEIITSEDEEKEP